MADPSAGLFVVLEGADGSGKSAITNHLLSVLRDADHTVRRIDRARPTGDEAHAALVRAVDQLFRSPGATAAGWQHLSLAAAAQYHSILHAQVLPALAAGQTVVAESWWDKTWVRFGIEAELTHRLDAHQRQELANWQRSLLPPSPLPADQRLTVLIDTRSPDRVTWYEAAGCPDPVLDHTGRASRNPRDFGEFTDHIATRLLRLARLRGWPVLTNGMHRPTVHVTTELRHLIERHIHTRGHPEAEPT